jgi:hypothetical protein
MAHDPNSVELKVSYHPSGRYTLTEKSGTRTMSGDPAPSPPLFGNMDKAEFYREVAKRIAQLAGQGKSIKYNDVD